MLYLTPLDFLRSHIQSVLDAVCELQRDHPCQVDFYLIDNSVDKSYRTDVLALVGEWSDENSVNIELVVSGVNCGYGRGNNLVEHRLESQYHLVVNPDVLLRPDALVKAFAFMASHADAGVLSAAVKTDVAGVAHVVKAYPDSLTLMLRYLSSSRLNDLFRARLDRYACATLVDQVAAVDLVGGCFMFMRTDLFRQLGGFDQRYFMYFEDFDLCRRMQPLAKVYFVPEVGVSHYGGDVGRKGWRHHVYFAR